MRTPCTARRTAHTACVSILIAILAALSFTATAERELAFCAPINGWPAADRERGGYDMDIAQLIADELDATATFTWVKFDEIGIRDSLHSGVCDLMVGMGEGVAGTLSTVAYLRTPYVFVSLEERDLTITSMDDPLLDTLLIGTYQFGTPTLAISARGLTNRVEFPANLTAEGVDAHTPILEAVLDGTVDVGIVYGPEAGILARDGAPLRIEQVRPEIDFGETIIQLSRIWTIATRPGDEALRDRVNTILAVRWDDIQAIFESYGTPTLELPQPQAAPPLSNQVLRVGVIYPAKTPAQLPGFEVGEEARLATLLAENELARLGALSDRVEIFKASAPTPAAALRAAEGLILDDEVDILIGGYGTGVAVHLARYAASQDVVFLNTGDEHGNLRSVACYPTTLHVAPDVHAYVRAAVATGLALEPAPLTWYLVVERPYAEDDGAERVAAEVAAVGGVVAGTATVDTGQFLYFDVMDDIESTDADAVLLIMNEDQQELFLTQSSALDEGRVVTGLPTLRSQARAYLQRFLQVSEERMTTPRVAVWDPSLENDVNERFAARTAEVMGGAAWTTYAAFKLVFDAAERDVGRDAHALVESWLGRDATALGDGPYASFRTGDQQLVTRLYLVAPVEGAAWGRSAAAKAATARVVAHVEATTAWPQSSEAASGSGACEAP